MEIIKLDKTGSTNDYLLNIQTQDELCVVSDFQTAGRGMGDNTWESEAGKNLLFSILVHPVWLPIQEQYLMSMVHAIALRQAISNYVSLPDSLTIKWPNDIYYHDKKLSGTRIDINLCGMKIQDMVIGTGVNINQKLFHSDAPNPVSLFQIENKEFKIDLILKDIIDRFLFYQEILKKGDKQLIINLYHDYLYRRVGKFPYKDKDGSFIAEIVSVAPNGIITLKREDGNMSEYEFKQLVFLHDH